MSSSMISGSFLEYDLTYLYKFLVHEGMLNYSMGILGLAMIVSLGIGLLAISVSILT